MRLHTGTVTRPRWQSRPYKMTDAQRRNIHGPLLPMQEPTLFAKLINHLKGRECEPNKPLQSDQ